MPLSKLCAAPLAKAKVRKSWTEDLTVSDVRVASDMVFMALEMDSERPVFVRGRLFRRARVSSEQGAPSSAAERVLNRRRRRKGFRAEGLEPQFHLGPHSSCPFLLSLCSPPSHGNGIETVPPSQGLSACACLCWPSSSLLRLHDSSESDTTTPAGVVGSGSSREWLWSPARNKSAKETLSRLPKLARETHWGLWARGRLTTDSRSGEDGNTCWSRSPPPPSSRHDRARQDARSMQETRNGVDSTRSASAQSSGASSPRHRRRTRAPEPGCSPASTVAGSRKEVSKRSARFCPTSDVEGHPKIPSAQRDTSTIKPDGRHVQQASSRHRTATTVQDACLDTGSTARGSCMCAPHSMPGTTPRR
mmetsp:Transcript_10026/g.28528  ORF Transcript_10026/g.28528 Transcript_10026/m.28528 type:complete len:362 (-) Transcript_10026:329-1414(-)